jgi:hypothetical protein
MDFKDPSILIALAALAIPLAIHLLGRRRAKEIILPTARFADNAHQAARGRVWIRRWGLLALRLAIIFCLVAAVAGPYLASAPAPSRDAPDQQAGREVAGAPSANQSPAQGGTTASLRSRLVEGAAGLAPAARPSVALLVVDAADEEDLRVRSADLVAAAFAGDAAESEKVTRRKAADVDRAAVEAADVIFWVGSRAPTRADVLPAVAGRGGLVWIPANPRPPDAALAAALGIKAGPLQAASGGMTIDPGGYVSDLLDAFEGGTSGDLGEPVFRQRLAIEAAGGGRAVSFRDGAAAIVVRAGGPGAGRIVALAVGPAPCWGDLAGRAEFVVLAHSLAESLGPGRGRQIARASSRGEVAGTTDANQTPPQADATASSRSRLDLTGWLILALATVLATEGALAAKQSAGLRRPETQ